MENSGETIGKRVTPRTILTAGIIFLLVAGAMALFSGGSEAGWGFGTGSSVSKNSNGRISATIDPDNIAMGEAAILVVQVSGEASGPPTLKPVNGLRFYSMGRSSQYQSINGRVSATTSYLFQVQAEHSGKFVIPPVEADINGQTLKSGPVALNVTGSTSLQSGRNVPSSPRSLQRGSSTRSSNDIAKGQLMSWEEGKPAFLRVLPRAGRAYVGELIPIEIKAYFRQGIQATLRTLPVIQGDAFACRDLRKKPEQTQEILDGTSFNVLTWNTAISAVKEGEQPVSAELNAVVGIPEQSRRSSPFGRGLFDDDFFRGFFQNIREEPITLTNPRLNIRILPLPKMGRPKNFSGAVGKFKLSTTATPQKLMVGDPITVKMRVTGTGNFDRVSTPVLNVGKDWKTYRPSSSFNAADSSGFRGEKLFEEAVIPGNLSIRSLPPVTFTYFDTEKEQYVTLKTKAIPLTLTAAQTPPSLQAPVAESTTKAEDTAVQKSAGNLRKTGLAPIQVAMGTPVKSLRPLIENPWFIGAQGFPVGILFMGLFFSRRQKKRLNDPGIIHKKQVNQKVSRSIRDMNRAITAHDVTAFFDACRSAAQERLGEIWGQAPHSITLAEIRHRLGNDAPGMAEVFEKADAVAYSGQSFGPEELKKLRDLVVFELKNLKSC